MNWRKSSRTKRQQKLRILELLEARELLSTGLATLYLPPSSVASDATMTTLGPRGSDVAALAVSEGTKA